MPQIFYITGADRHMFDATCCLLASFSHRMPGHRLWVADFGFTAGQQELLAALGVLLPMPAQVRSQFPPDMPFDKPELGVALYAKASLLEYVRPMEFDALMWIDADMVVTGDLEPAAEQLCADLKERGRIFAAAPALPLTDFGGLIRGYKDVEGSGVLPFAGRVAELGQPLKNRYVNSGLFMATDRDALARWRYLTCTTERHTLFEQNAFNLVVHMQPDKLEWLDVTRWNLNNYMLNETEVAVKDNYPAVRHEKTDVLLVHATSNRAGDYFRADRSFKAGGFEMSFGMKFFNKPELRVLQEFYLQNFVAMAGRAAAAAGLAQEQPRASA